MTTQLTEKKIQRRLDGFFASWKYNVDGMYVFEWESDKLIWTKAGYIYEFEVKISRADYRNDFKHKARKHAVLSGEKYTPQFHEYFKSNKEIGNVSTVEEWEAYCRKYHKQYFCDYYKRPNYFYYAVPEEMLEPDEVPPYAGLIYITTDKRGFEDEPDKWTYGIKTVRKAPRLHDTKYGDDELNLGEKFYYNMKTWQKNYREQVDYSLMYRERLQYELDSKHQEKSYRQLEDELEAARRDVDYYKAETQKYHSAYMAKAKDTDYCNIERHVFMDVLEQLGINVREKFKEITAETERRYTEKYPNRK